MNEKYFCEESQFPQIDKNKIVNVCRLDLVIIVQSS